MQTNTELHAAIAPLIQLQIQTAISSSQLPVSSSDSTTASTKSFAYSGLGLSNTDTGTTYTLILTSSSNPGAAAAILAKILILFAMWRRVPRLLASIGKTQPKANPLFVHAVIGVQVTSRAQARRSSHAVLSRWVVGIGPRKHLRLGLFRRRADAGTLPHYRHRRRLH